MTFLIKDQKNWYEPTEEHLEKLNCLWKASYSGGKDSTSLVTWLEWLRRREYIDVPLPRLILSDTGVEYPFLRNISNKLMDRLQKCGWDCEIVTPKLKDKLYNQIFGRGLTPIHPGIRNMRWCTRATKINPMERHLKENALDGILQLSGLRYGESKSRDEKLERLGSCQAGGECGLPTRNIYAPIIKWETPEILMWLRGWAKKEDREIMKDIFSITIGLTEVYGVRTERGLGVCPPKVSMLRFGCIGCPAISKDRVLLSLTKDDPQLRFLEKLYSMWRRLRLPKNRIFKEVEGKRKYGPIKMEVRKEEFEKFLNIQERSGVTLVNQEDIDFIKSCWQNKVYPRGWSAEMEEISHGSDRSN